MEGNNLDRALKAMSDPERREVLDELLEQETVTVDKVDKSKAVSLMHNHLPLLASGGFIEYEHTEDHVVVRRGGNWDTLADMYTVIIESAFAKANE